MRKYILAFLSITIALITLDSMARTIPESQSKVPQIKGAKFKVGECASWPLGDKVNTSKINSSIMVAGKPFYILDGINNKIAGHDAEKFNQIATKISCPQRAPTK